MGGRPSEFGVKTRTSRRCVDLDATTVAELRRWRRRLRRDGLPHGHRRLDVLQPPGRPLNPSRLTNSSTAIASTGLPRIGSTTYATPTPRCSSPPANRSRSSRERLGHAHPAFTMHTYQHLLPGMSAAAAAASPP